MSILRKIAAALAATAMLAAVPATAQFSGRYEFFKAVKDGDVLKVKSLIDEPGSALINLRNPESGEMALHSVTRNRDVPWMNFLITNGADVNVRDREGNTPMMIAAQLGFVDGISVLHARKADVDLANSRGETPLIVAVQRRNLPAVRALLQAGANPDTTDHVAGLSADDYAARDRRSAAIARAITDSRKKADEADTPRP